MSTARLLGGGAAAAIALALAPAAPARAAGALAYTVSVQGLGAFAVFSDEPEQGPVPGTVYHETAVSAGALGAREGGPAQASPYLVVDQVAYSYDLEGSYQRISESVGAAFGSAVTYDADRRLSQASASGALPLRTCDTSGTCLDEGTITVDVQWTGYGPVLRSRGTDVHRGDGGTVFVGRGSDALRAASAASSLPGSLVEGLVDYSSFSEKCIGSGC
ncbi:MAG TPA: hypothetical protein VL281_08970 [Mycobacteriales bacterium]|nr:hypothetical protein [Mycobacteriales bacterium]